MSSTTVAQHATQPLNFGPEWLRALSTPESTTPMPSSGGSGGGNVFKFAGTKYRYSKDEIIALRANVTERLAEDVRNEILENLKDVESVFRPNIIEPLTLISPTAEETAKMNSLSSYISGRTPGGGGRGGSNSQQSQQQQQQHDSRSNRGGSMSNGRGGGSRGRGGRDNAFGSNRGNTTADDTGENGGNSNGGGGDDSSAPSSSWSSRGGYHSRGGGSFGNRVRSYDDRDQSFRRGSATRQTSDGWRRSRGDEDDDRNNDQNEDPPTGSGNGSTSWTSRGGGQTRRGGGSGSMEHRTKSNEKWSHSDDRPGPSSSFESNQQRGGWRSNATLSDRDLNSRRPQPKRERIPEWMDDGNDGDNPLSNATFEKDGTFTGASSARHNKENSNEQHKLQTQSSNEESSTGYGNNVTSSRQQEEKKSGKVTPPQSDTAAVNIPSAPSNNIPKPTPPVQQPIPSWDDEFEPSDVAKTVVEATLADDHDYSPPISSQPTPSAGPIIPSQRAPQPPPPVIIDDKQWYYKDPQNTIQGPFSAADMERWFNAGYFTMALPVKRFGETKFSTIQQLRDELGRVPFRADAPTLPPPVQQPVVPEPQKFNPMTYATPSATSNTFVDDYLLQHQPRQNLQQSMLFNRQTSVPIAPPDRKPVTSPSMVNPQLQTYFGSHQQHSQSSTSLFSPNLVNDPVVAYSQQPQLQRSISATNQQQQEQQSLFHDDVQRSFRHGPSQPSTSSFFGANIAGALSQQPDDIMTRLTQAMQSHGQQQQEKIEEQRRLEQQRRDLEVERLKLAQQAEQLRIQREEDERRQIEQQHKYEEEMRKKTEAAAANKQLLEQMKEMAKAMDQRKQQQPVKPQPKAEVEVDPFIAFQQSLQYQKEQQAKIEAQKAENVRRYQQQQQQLREPSQPSPQQAQVFKLPETANWARHSSQGSEQNQPLNFAEIQKQEQEQERRVREAALAAQQLAKAEASSNPNGSSSNNNKPGSWARTLFAGATGSNNTNNSSLASISTHTSSDHDTNDNPVPESPITSYNQQATNAPKSRSSTSQSSTPWNSSTNIPNTSLQDIQRQQQQQSQNESKASAQQSQVQVQAQAQQASPAHSTPAWGGAFQHTTPSPQSSSSILWGDNQPTSSKTKQPTATSGNKPSTPWTELKSAAAPLSTKSNSSTVELTKSEREVKCLFSATRTQDALSKWAQTQFKDNLQAIDVPTLVTLLKDIDSAEEIFEYVQPYIGSVVKSKEFAKDFILKRKQLANAGPDVDNDHLNELAMAPTSSSGNSGHGADEGFQLASSNGQKKKAKKMKGQKIDVKQLGFMVNNRPEQRDDIDRVLM
ncbi:unnamed protein product [Adineta ricciae]|uniref:GYF domain-containing protein n=1 Tax=Adineta ricciae TaxID=249248 RepID=A0A815Y872_ADIRI|nr:unnamed protein product [Adineta ricciae]